MLLSRSLRQRRVERRARAHHGGASFGVRQIVATDIRGAPLHRYKFVRRGIAELRFKLLGETRATLQEDITWARQLLTRNEK